MLTQAETRPGRESCQTSRGQASTTRHLRKPFRPLISCAVLGFGILLMISACAAQQTPPKQPEMVLPQDFKKYPGLLDELGQLQKKLQQEVHYPKERTQSRLLPLLPESTTFYAAFPNYGDALHQALTVFQQEREHSPVLRDWWQHGDMASNGPKAEDSIEKVSQLAQYLGDEIVVAGAIGKDHKDSSLLILAEVQKPGLKEVLQQTLKELSDKPIPGARVFDMQELAAVKDTSSGDFVFLVRPDYVVGGTSIATLRAFNDQLEKGSHGFASTPFAQRITRAYEGGTSIVGALDLHRLIAQIPINSEKDRMTFQRTGFADAQYLVWEHKSTEGEAASQMEVSFTGPRRGVASWLAAPGPLGSLDFMSPKAVIASAMLLKNPSEIFDDISELVSASNPNFETSVSQVEQGLKFNLKNDLFGRLGGEIAIEVDSLAPQPVWKLFLRTNDADGLQTTLTKLLAGPRIGVAQSEEGGLIYNTLQVPAGPKATEVCYVFVDGYLVVGSSRETVAEAVRLHKSGESLAKSESFRAALPTGRLAQSSAVFYEDPMAVAGLTLRQASPELAQFISQAALQSKPILMSAYGEESALREASKSAGVDVGATLVIAAIAIPNLLRARMAANDSSAAASIRTVNTAQVAYAATYPKLGFARDLASLGPGLKEPSTPTASHASLLDSTLANASCTVGNWCTKSGYRFMIRTACQAQPCHTYVVIGTPVSNSTGTRNYCSTSDAVVRFKSGPPLVAPITASQCRTWAPLQ